MIKLLKTDGSEIIINADLIEQIKETPDTVITMTNGKKILVENTAGEIIEKVINYRQKIIVVSSRTGEI
ncbi:MAG: flagellar FlbD family protein [Halanaerobiales bacterium]|nr:flagellar FlbD family protein [Halanaerobiales bacterium]